MPINRTVSSSWNQRVLVLFSVKEGNDIFVWPQWHCCHVISCWSTVWSHHCNFLVAPTAILKYYFHNVNIIPAFCTLTIFNIACRPVGNVMLGLSFLTRVRNIENIPSKGHKRERNACSFKLQPCVCGCKSTLRAKHQTQNIWVFDQSNVESVIGQTT